MTGKSFRPRRRLTEKQDLTGKIANGVRPCDRKPLSRPRQLCPWQLRLRLRHASNRSQQPALCYLKCHCRRIYSGKGDCICPWWLRLLRVVPAERVRRLGANPRPGHGFPRRGAELQSLMRSSARLRGCAQAPCRELIPDEARGSRLSREAPNLLCYFSDTGTTVRSYVTSCSKWSKNLESDSPWKCSVCAPGLSGGRDA